MKLSTSLWVGYCVYRIELERGDERYVRSEVVQLLQGRCLPLTLQYVGGRGKELRLRSMACAMKSCRLFVPFHPNCDAIASRIASTASDCIRT